MKQILIIGLTLITILSCKAQDLPLFKPADKFSTNGAYYKDFDGDLTKLVGTWEYNNGSEILKINFKKSEHYDVNLTVKNITYFEDLLYGEYQYINSSGIEIINTLSNIDAYSDVYTHLIKGNYIINKTHLPICDDCSDEERRIVLFITDPERSYYKYEIIIRHISIADSTTETEQLKIKIRRIDMTIVPEGQPDDNRLPVYQELILNKL